MTPTEAERLERERLDAERRYNAALTNLDRVVVDAAAQAEPSRDDVARVTTALIVFLQQITAFVETKDRQLAADAARRFDASTATLESIAELHTQMAIMQRRLQAITRDAITTAPRSALSTQHPAPGILRPAPDDDVLYLAFEDQFRGSDQEIRERLSAYLPIFEGRSNVLDVGCGRGEFLSALKQAGVPARGVDANGEMAAIARDRGLEAAHGDALDYVTKVPEASLGGLIATQVVEHLEPSYLMRLVDAAARALKPGAPIVLETINPACWLAFFSSYIRDLTHVRPIHPETLQYLLRAGGFERVEIRYSAPVPDHVKMTPVAIGVDLARADHPVARALADVAHTVNANAAILNNLLFSHLDYAAIGYRL